MTKSESSFLLIYNYNILVAVFYKRDWFPNMFRASSSHLDIFLCNGAHCGWQNGPQPGRMQPSAPGAAREAEGVRGMPRSEHAIQAGNWMYQTEPSVHSW